MTDNDRQRLIRREIRRNRLIRRLRSFFSAGMLLISLFLIVVSGYAAKHAFNHQNLYRVSIQEKRHLLIEKGRCLPWLEFETVDLDYPALHPNELLSVIENKVITADPNSPQIFSDFTVMQSYLAVIYRSAAAGIRDTSLRHVSRAVTLLETANDLDPLHPPSELVSALILLSDQFASPKEGENLIEAWRCLSQADALLAQIDSHSSGDLKKLQETVATKSKRLSERLERAWFHRVREHLTDGNLRAAEVIVSELEDVGFNRSEIHKFRADIKRWEDMI